MSYAVVPAPAKKRPGVVAAASALMYLSAVVIIVSSAIGLIPLPDEREVIIEHYADQPDLQRATELGVTIGVIGAVVLYLALGIGLVVVGALVGKGKQPARVIAWVLSGLLVLCLGCGAISSAFSGALSGIGGAQDQELTDKLAAVIPAWVTATSTTFTIIGLLINITVIILLALPAANDFFRKEQQIWVPPTAFPGGDPTLPPPPPPAPPAL